MLLADLVHNGRIVLSPRNAGLAWLYDEIGDVIGRTAPVELDPAGDPARPHRYTVSRGILWETGTTLDVEVDGSRVTALQIVRPGPLGDLLGHDIHDVDDVLIVALAQDEAGASHVRQMARRFEARLALTPSRRFTISLIPIGAEGFTLEATFDPGTGPSLADLGRLLGYDSSASHAIDLDWLPEELTHGTLVELRDLRATVRHTGAVAGGGIALPGGAGGVSIDTIHVGLDFLDGRLWPLIPGIDVLTVGDLAASLDVDYPLDPAWRFPSITVSGAIKLAQQGEPDAEIAVSARWPDHAVSGSLRAGQIDLAQLIGKLGAPGGALPKGGLAITSLSCGADRVEDERSFTLSGRIESGWSLDVGPAPVVLSPLSFHASYSDARKSKLTGGFSAGVVIGGLDFLVSAEAAGGGWQFAGGLAPGSAPISLDALAKGLAAHFGAVQVPEPLAKSKITAIGTTFNTESHTFDFDIACQTDMGGAVPLSANLHLACEKSADGSFTKTFTGHLDIGGRFFDIQASRGRTTEIIAVYASPASDAFNLGLLAERLGMPKLDFEIGLQAGILALKSGGSDAVTLGGIDLDGGIDISALPLVGRALPPGERLALALQVLYGSRALTKNDDGLVTRVNQLLPTKAPHLPAWDKIGKNLTVVPRLDMAGTAITLVLPVAIDQGSTAVLTGPGSDGPLPGSRTDTGGTDAGGVKWFPIQKQFGPVHISRVGGSLAGGEVTFLVDGGLALGPITFSMDGLSVSSPLAKPEPRFALQGLGLDFSSGPFTIGGSFLRKVIPGGVEYAGAATIRAKTLTLSAIGAYDEVGRDKSLLVYATLDYPIGGPSFFFVTGIAAGFGYNRRLLAPAIGEIKTHPLVQEAVNPRKLPTELGPVIDKLDRVIPNSPGDYFLAVGVKFNSFKLIDSFVLLMVGFGKHFEIDLLGFSTLIVPTPDAVPNVTPLAKVEMALEASYQPDAGIIKVEAQITDASYLFSGNCKLTGGFAFCTWLTGEHGGDFVVTLGGFHPSYVRPTHYPDPPRVGISWQVDPSTQIKGDLYYALTPEVLMAGGHMEATYERGAIKAWCRIGADFLINWHRFHYDARMYVDIGGSVTFEFFGSQHLSIDLGADLHVWGPEFAGHARVNLYIASFDFDFSTGPPHAAQPLKWADFARGFLPHGQLITIAVQDGLIETVTENNDEIWVLNPKSFRLFTDSVVPAKQYQVGNGAAQDAASLEVVIPGTDRTVKPKTTFGIPMMDLSDKQVLKANHKLIVTKTVALPNRMTREEDATHEFAGAAGRIKQSPKALWGAPGEPQHSDDGLFGWTLCGLELGPQPVMAPAETHSIDRDILLAGRPDVVGQTAWGILDTPVLADADDASRRQIVMRDLAAPASIKRRSALLQAFRIREDALTFPPGLAADAVEAASIIGAPPNWHVTS